ncbi:MAG: hypothetical protein AAF628_17120 [Planctomycetota bacterium]
MSASTTRATCSTFLWIFALAPLALAQSGRLVAESAESTSLEELTGKMRAEARDASTASFRVVTSGVYPGGARFQIEAETRVLGATHFHRRLVFSSDDGLSAEQETVKTPKGVWMRERDPSSGEVFLRMSRDLAAKLEQAAARLGEAADVPGTVGNQPTALRGAEMIESLTDGFDLRVERRVIRGREFFVVKGDARLDEPLEEDDPSAPDHVELLVRTEDLVISQMVQLRQGQELMRVELSDLVLGAPMDKDSFALELPPGEKFIDAMDHEPAAAHIEHVLAQVAAEGGEDEPPRDG